MNADNILVPVAEDMAAVNRLISVRLRSDVALINQLGTYIINSGGKRLRPLLVLLSARACGYCDHQHVQLAAIVEFIHTATLLHDDVVDASELRRGQETANAVWGNEASVLVGDFLYSRAFQLMVELGNARILEILADATNTIAEGEVLQLLNVHNPDTTEDEYLRVILSKTAKLFEASAQLGAVVTGMDQQIESALAEYGLHLGTAFQLIDDVLDYNAEPEQLGKNIGDDLAEGKPTLPLIYAMENGNHEDALSVRKAIEAGGLDDIDAVVAALRRSDAIAYTQRVAQAEADKALAALAILPDSVYRNSLEELAKYSVKRSY
ncbi:MAG: octaprenyl diphosphate synthase [Gammaproteobacteria bacterium]|nr:octaprenyl diphosphate synthase [Gammaproteobacteria bacterium]